MLRRCIAGGRRVDVDEVGGPKVLYSEGLAPAVALFLLTWIGTFTAAHSDVS